MSKPHIIHHEEHGALTEREMMSIKSDTASLFASDENLANFKHFYHRGSAESIIKIRVRLQAEIDAAKLREGGTHRDAYVGGLKKALSLIW